MVDKETRGGVVCHGAAQGCQGIAAGEGAAGDDGGVRGGAFDVDCATVADGRVVDEGTVVEEEVGLVGMETTGACGHTACGGFGEVMGEGGVAEGEAGLLRGEGTAIAFDKGQDVGVGHTGFVANKEAAVEQEG